ncbi:MAG: hypothetical protein JW990_06150, partial [Thermoleophilia bacterium]|nr:hypothetical protein [Thermoleophilia bacterium]
ARADTIDPTLIGPAELTVGQFVAVICCAAVVIAAGIWALVHIRRRRRREPGAATSATSGDADRER